MSKDIGHKDIDGKEIHLNDILLTDEAGWHGRVVKGYSTGDYMLIDESGGFCTAEEWHKYKIVYRLGTEGWKK